MSNFIDEVIEKHNFIVRVERFDNNSLEVQYTDKIRTRYTISYKSEEYYAGIIYRHFGETIEKDLTEYLALPIFLIRVYILSDIYYTCRRLNLPNTIVRFYDAEVKRKYLTDILVVEMSEEFKEKEKILVEKATRVFLDESLLHSFDDELEQLGLLKAFNLLKGMLV